MYRLLHARSEVVERRRLSKHAPAQRPELLATGPNQVWSWDITKLKGPRKCSYYYLYIILDVFSRYVVGWCIAEKENAEIAEALIEESLAREGIPEFPAGTLTLHADRGSAMTSTTVAQLLIDLGVTRSHSRPHTSNDNPFSEAHFKTLKYRPQMPERFGSVEEARVLFRTLIPWYNHEHRHSGLALLSPATVHHGKAEAVTCARGTVLGRAYAAHPERFVRRAPKPPLPPTDVWINRPIARAVPGAAESSRDGSGGGLHAAAAKV
jgi:putative transposase